MRYVLLLLFLLTSSLAFGQTKTVLKNLSNNALTESFVVPSGASITINSGASIINEGTATGFTTGSVSWSIITGKPTTVAGYGITDALTAAAAALAYQPLDADLTSISLLSTTTFGRSLLTQADAAAARTTLGLGPLATQSLPVSIANGGTGSTTAQAARVALGTETLVAGAAQVAIVSINATAQTSWAGQYVDLDDGTEVCRFWFTVDGSGSAPSTPSPGRLQVVAVVDGASAIDVETAFLTAMSAQSSAFSAVGSSFGYLTVTNVLAAASPNNSSSFSDVSFNITTAGADSYRQLPAIDGSQLTNVTVTSLPNPTSSSLGGVKSSSAGANQYVNGLNGTGDLTYAALPADNTDTRLYTSGAVWVNPSPATPRRVFVRLVAGGGGGGSGRKGAVNIARFGGGGGAAGAVVEFWALTTELGASQSVVVGAGGTGGAAISADNTNGNNGTAGGDTTFFGVTSSGGNFGGAGGSGSGTAGGTSVNSCISGVSVANSGAGGAGGSAAGVTGTAVNAAIPTGGGGGGGLDTSNTIRAGGTGGPMGAAAVVTLLGGTAGASGGGNGGNGNAGRGSGTGGGGGGSNNVGAGGNGGNGAGFGSGGGGGAAGTNGVGNSGAGGNGTPGYALIITY